MSFISFGWLETRCHDGMGKRSVWKLLVVGVVETADAPFLPGVCPYLPTCRVLYHEVRIEHSLEP